MSRNSLLIAALSMVALGGSAFSAHGQEPAPTILLTPAPGAAQAATPTVPASDTPAPSAQPAPAADPTPAAEPAANAPEAATDAAESAPVESVSEIPGDYRPLLPLDYTALVPGESNAEISNLNSAFVLTADDMTKLVKAGKRAAKDDEILPKVTSNAAGPFVIVGSNNETRYAHVTFWNYKAFDLVKQVRNTEQQYDPLDIPVELLKNGASSKVLSFTAVLCSVPHFDHAGGLLDNADPDRITVKKIFLTDDKDQRILPAEVKSGPLRLLRTAFHGYSVIAGSGSSESTKYEGKTVYTTTSTVSTVPWTNSQNYYKQRHDIAFPLFDKDGHPLVTKGTKRLVLHVVLTNDEYTATYKLEHPKF